MGRWGFGLLDSEMAWDDISDLSTLAGVDLCLIGCLNARREEGDPPIMSSRDTKAHLDDGKFDLVFYYLYARREYHTLLLFVAVSMRVGANIRKDQLREVKSIYKKADPQHFFHFDKQIEYALLEYNSGEPYQLRDFDENGKLIPKTPKKKRKARAIDGESRKLVSGEKQELPGEDAGDLEGPAAKQAKV